MLHGSVPRREDSGAGSSTSVSPYRRRLRAITMRCTWLVPSWIGVVFNLSSAPLL